MKIKLLVVLSFSLALLASTATALTESAAVLESQCKDSTRVLFCMGYILGVVESYDTWSPLGGPVICLPQESFTAGEAMRIVLRYIDQNPDVLHKDANSVVLTAIKASFPCH